MGEQNTDPTTETADEPTAQTPLSPESDMDNVDRLQAEIDKWKSLSRKHERNFKNSSAELEELKRAQLSEAEKAITDARQAGRSEAAAEFGARLAEAQLRAEAATAGVEIPDGLSKFFDPSRFLDESGSPDGALISEFVSSLAPSRPRFPQNTGVGPQGRSATDGQLTYEDVRRMSRDEIVQARKDGRLDHLMFGES